VRRIAGSAPNAANPPDRVTVDIHQAGDRWEARITTHSPSTSGERRLEGASCARVAEAVVLIVAMTLDPMGVAEHVTERKDAESSASRDEPRDESPRDEPRATPPAEQPALAESRDHPRFVVGARMAGDVGSLPAATLGATGVFGVQVGSVLVDAEGTLWLPRVAFVPPAASQDASSGSGGGEIHLYTGGLRGCWDFAQASGELRFAGCAGGEAGMSAGVGIGLARASQASGLWAAALTGLAFHRGGVSGLAYWFSVDAVFPIRRPTYAIDGVGSIFQASAIVGRASAGLEWLFP
jgi:hypothetical protein